MSRFVIEVEHRVVATIEVEADDYWAARDNYRRGRETTRRCIGSEILSVKEDA